MAQKEVTIRMYRQGLGDCFLLTFPREPKPFHMLLDCGALVSQHYDKELMKAVVRDIKETTGGHLDVVAATHEHWDHVSGFLDARDIFKNIDVDDVWVAWTEDPENSAAKRLKREFKKRKEAVRMALARLPEPERDEQLGVYRKTITELFGFFGGLAANGKGRTEEAWDNLLGMGRKVYCEPKNRPIELNGVEGVRVYILGPPEDPEYIRKRVSAKETYHEAETRFSLVDSFLAAVGGPSADADSRARAVPFEGDYRLEMDEAKDRDFFREHYGFDQGATDEWRRIDHDWLTVAGELALALDSYTNNTCLALAIELVDSDKVLLFPGDAQVGNWLSWGELQWKVPDGDGGSKTVKIDDLLARTVFYKVGHHGSHNATLRTNGLEKMESPDLVAMVPVHRKTADDQGWQFPYRPLWTRLKDKARCRVLLADAGLDEIENEATQRLSSEEWKSFKRRTRIADLFVEHRIPY